MIASRLRDARARAGLSRQRLAAKAGIGPDTILFLEQGKQTPRLETLSALAAALDVTLASLLDEPFDASRVA